MKRMFFLGAFFYFFPLFPVVAFAQQENLSPIHYQVMGDKKRTDAVASYMTSHGYAVTPVVEPGVYGQLNGKKWPGVRVAHFGAGPKEGIFVPVSDEALKKGLCSDQQELLGSLPKIVQGTVGASTMVSAPSSSSLRNSTKIIPPDPCGCGDIPWPAKGIWSDFPEGALGVEIQNRPNEHVWIWKTKRVVREGGTIRAICCFKSSVVPGTDEMEIAWGNGQRLHLWKDFGGCDGGAHCTTQILIFY